MIGVNGSKYKQPINISYFLNSSCCYQFEVTSKKKVTLMNILFDFLCQSV